MSAFATQLGRLLPEQRARRAGLAGQMLVPFLAVTLLARVLTDDQSSPNARLSGSFNLSGGIAVMFIVVAGAMLARDRRGLKPTALAVAWLTVWTAVAVASRGASAETVREGVREASVVALAVIVYNARGAITVAVAARIVQFMGFVAAVIAIYQLATNTGVDLTGELRSNGTFAHPDSAALFFAMAATVSLWCYIGRGRHIADALLFVVFAVALVSTYSIAGLVTLAAMLAALGYLNPGPVRRKALPWAAGAIVLFAFFATPLGSQRLAEESATNVASEQNTSLAWRVHKWKLLLPEWEHAPIFGHGLGATLTERPVWGNSFAGKPPHNEYVRYLVETGVVGLALLLWAVFILVRTIVRRMRAGLGTGIGGAALALAVVTGCMVNALADNTFINSPMCYAAALVVVGAFGTRAAGAGPSAHGGARVKAELRRGLSASPNI